LRRKVAKEVVRIEPMRVILAQSRGLGAGAFGANSGSDFVRLNREQFRNYLEIRDRRWGGLV
jgi:hypothetical protein